MSEEKQQKMEQDEQEIITESAQSEKHPEHFEGEKPEAGEEARSQNSQASETSQQESHGSMDDQLKSLQEENQKLKSSLEKLSKAFENLKLEYEKVQNERNQLLDIARRLKADFENYKKRVEKEKRDLLNRLKGEVIAQFLPVIDNLERVVESPGNDVESFKEGVKLIIKQFFEILTKTGVKEVGRVGEKFDPKYHEAFMREFRDDVEDGTITEVFTKGYIIDGFLIRAAKVKVALKPQEPASPSQKPSSEAKDAFQGDQMNEQISGEGSDKDGSVENESK